MVSSKKRKSKSAIRGIRVGVGADEDQSDKLCCNHLLYYVSIKGVVEKKVHFSIKGEC